MNEVERKYFEILHNDRAESADTFEKPAMRGLWRSVVEKYSDQAHFIYELIQNADDAGATHVRFILENDKLVFAHNGTRHFSISDPATEEKDATKGTLGDINSITGIAFSNKPDQQNKIGKFGVGFKAVFQYTSTPHIYDPKFRFRMDRYIVPTILEDDCPIRRPDETLFIFPFNHKDRTAKESYNDIAGKLKSLSNPILFLSNLKNISFEIGSLIGSYGKSIVEERSYDDGTHVQKIRLLQNNGSVKISQNLWLFSRCHDGLNYSVGFFIDDKDNLIPINEPAYCFFPTKETTGLKFIVHAPFLLTDSREGIRAGVKHNNDLISLLAKLSRDSLLYLRDIGEEANKRIINDEIFSIIPIDENEFCELDDTSSISFKPFYTAIKLLFKKERIIPTSSGYTFRDNAYWADVSFLAKLFSDEQLADICGNPDAKWVFTSLGRDETQRSKKGNNNCLFDYINEITFTGLNEQHLIRGRFVSYYSHKKDIKGITSSFIEKQDVDWLHKFYKWLSETSNRTNLAKYVPIFLDQNSKAVAAFDENNDHLLVFLPNKDIPNCRTIREDILDNNDTAAFIKKLGITTPSIRDEIYNTIIPLYKKGGEIDTYPHFRLFFRYYCQCPQEEIDSFIEEIRELDFIYYSTKEDPHIYRGAASELYMPTEELNNYFETLPSTKFVEYREYLNIVGASKEKQLNSFFAELGVIQTVSIYTRKIGLSEVRSRSDLPMPHSSTNRNYSEKYIDGCKELVEYIVSNKSKEKSILLWNQLLKIINTCGYGGLKNALKGSCDYFYYSSKRVSFVSSNATLLRTAKWLINKKGKFVSPEKVTKATLSDDYDLLDDRAESLLDFLAISNETQKAEDDANLTDSQKERMKWADYFFEQGFTQDDIEELKRIRNAREARLAGKATSDSSTGVSVLSNTHFISDDGAILDDLSEKFFGDMVFETDEELHISDSNEKKSATTSQVAKDIFKRTQNLPTPHWNSVLDEEDDIDSDELNPSSVDYAKKIEKAKEKAARDIDRISYQEELQQKALSLERYSYGWFKALLELETLNSNTNNLNSKEVSISFAKVEREPGTKRTLVLKQPNRYIPQFMEDLADIPLVLHFGDQTKTLAIEVANIKSYTLRVKLKSHVNIEGLDFSKITEAKIDAKSPVFLLEELRKQIIKLGEDNKISDDYNMQDNLCENIEFIFGPPGTGKTTYLARDILIPLMQKKDSAKVLVLTPTNKSADVLVKRIMDIMKTDTSYNKWLVRFGGTADETIEDSPIFRDKTFDIRQLKKNVTVTTIARFPYDFFMPGDSRVYLNGLNWDYIVIDEASMIPLVNIIYPLYKKTPKKFIIAGDPFQIEPITSVDLWKNENIYTMVHLDSFVEPNTIPYDYKVKLLTTQYRSIPSVGNVFSELIYGGILDHYRDESERRSLNIESKLKIDSLNIIKFPVSKYESIYRCKRLQRSSSYQVYSALFTFEFANYFAKLIADANPNKFFRIGIIAPYRAQADLIDKLICSKDLPKEVEIQVATIHGFQGDECDIIFTVFNTPPTISSSEEMFLNKRNIINVSISRAKDYLFVIMPDDETENVHNLRLVKRVEQLIKGSGKFTEYLAPELEEKMLGSSTYLEDNSFSTGHQSVNVYGLPEKRYEIRSEDSAVDIQVHQPADYRRKIKPYDSASKPVLVRDWTEVVCLKEKTVKCPLDNAMLGMKSVSILKKNGAIKKINMQVCPICGKKYLLKKFLPTNISDYYLSCVDLDQTAFSSDPIQTNPINTQGNQKSIQSRPYKKGDYLIGKHILILHDGKQIIGYVKGDKDGYISLSDSGVIRKYEIRESDRTKFIRVIE